MLGVTRALPRCSRCRLHRVPAFPDAPASQRAPRHGAVEPFAAALGLACRLGCWLLFLVLNALSWRACWRGVGFYMGLQGAGLPSHFHIC